MRSSAYFLGLVLAGWLNACGGEEPSSANGPNTGSSSEPTPGVGTPNEPRSAGVAEYGGVRLIAGDYPVEVVAHNDGRVELFALGDAAPAPGHTYATVRLLGDDGQTQSVVLTYNPSHSHYDGQMRGALPLPGAIEVVLDVENVEHRGRASRIPVVGLSSPTAGPPRAHTHVGVRAPNETFSQATPTTVTPTTFQPLQDVSPTGIFGPSIPSPASVDLERVPATRAPRVEPTTPPTPSREPDPPVVAVPPSTTPIDTPPAQTGPPARQRVPMNTRVQPRTASAPTEPAPSRRTRVIVERSE